MTYRRSSDVIRGKARHGADPHSWLNQIERSFALITQREIRRVAIVDAKDLVATIELLIAPYNVKAKP